MKNLVELKDKTIRDTKLIKGGSNDDNSDSHSGFQWKPHKMLPGGYY